MRFGAQLYIFTKKYQIDKDINLLLDGLAHSGYTAIEGGPDDAASYLPMLQQHNLTLCGYHLLTPALRNLQPLTNYMHTLHSEDINASGPLVWNERSPQDYREAAHLLNSAGKALRGEGIHLHYHNHDFEFAPTDGATTGMDVLLENLDFRFVDLCVDIGFVWLAGLDPLDFLHRHKDIIGYAHLRDFAGKTSTELGKGEMPLPTILAQLNTMPALRYVVVEQDPIAEKPLESMAISLQYLRTISNF